MMAWGSEIERRLFAYLSPLKRAEIQDYLDSLESDPPMECANCGQMIGDHDSFCGEECKAEFVNEDVPSNPCPQQTGAGMGLIGGSR
jgi:hypothetical protein